MSVRFQGRQGRPLTMWSNTTPTTNKHVSLNTLFIMKKKNKYLYGWNLWTNYGSGWEIGCAYLKPEETYADVKRDAKRYREAGAAVRITETRILNA